MGIYCLLSQNTGCLKIDGVPFGVLLKTLNPKPKQVAPHVWSSLMSQWFSGFHS